MKILSIETSCDDTGLTIFEATGGVTNARFKILSDNLASQVSIHIPYGGVYPALAKREHLKNLPILLEKTLKESKLDKKEKPVDLICVTYGPGLPPSLWTGITFAQELSKKWRVPVVPVNHMEGHVLSIFGKNKGKFKIIKTNLPALALLVSGGHTQLVLMKKWMQYEIIGETLDDAVGEAFDKVARMMDLPYPGGPQISRLAEIQRALHFKSTDNFLLKIASKSRRRAPQSPEVQSSLVTLPRPMLYTKNFDFSFSGLKTSVLYLIQKIKKEKGELSDEMKSQIALEFENAAVECLTYKTAKAIEKYKIKTLIVAGGVAANKHLRNEIKKVTKKSVKLLLPTRELARDNSIMIGIAGYLNYIKNKKKTKDPMNIKADGRLRL